MQHQEQLKSGISSIIYDLTKWDYQVAHSGVNSLDLTITKNNEEMVDASLSDEELKLYRKRVLTPLEENELEIFLDDLLWEDEFASFAHLSTLQVEYHNGRELAYMMEEKYKDDLLFIQYNEETAFMGYLEEASVKRLNGSDTLVCYFSPVDEDDDDSELIRTTIMLKPDIKAIAMANSIKVEGGGETLEVTRHVEHTH